MMASMSEDLSHTSSTSITDKKRTTILSNPAWSNKTIKHGGERERARRRERRRGETHHQFTDPRIHEKWRSILFRIFVCFKTPTRNTILFCIFVDLNNITVNVAVGVWHIGNR